MKKNKLASFLIICMFSAMLVGCNKEETEVIIETEEENMFGLTESEQKMYAEYAAGVLMKYNAGSNMRVLEGQTLIDQEAKEQAAKEQAEKRAQLAAEYEANKKSSSTKDKQNSGSGSSSTSEGTGVSYISDMSVATGTENFSISYVGYEVTDSYPNTGDDIFMAMDATQGKVLLVTKYNVTNISGQTEKLDMFSKQAKFRLNLNGKRYQSQYTLLLDDLSMYKGDIDAGAIIDTVLIFEIPETEASNISDMVLSITVGNEVSSMQLLGGSSVMWTETAEAVDGEEENIDSLQESGSDTQENDVFEQESTEEYNDLAEEYLNALEAENSGLINEGNYDESGEGGNVTVVGSSRN